MDHRSPVRWCGVLRIRYMTGSRRLMLPEAMSIFARSVLLPSGNSPARIRRKRSRFSSTERLRYGDSRPGSVEVEADGLGVADVEIAVGLGRETRDDLAAEAARAIVRIDDLANEVRRPGLIGHRADRITWREPGVRSCITTSQSEILVSVIGPDVV